MNDPTTPATGRREQWGSRAGFLLATIGAAAGLGNIWRFAYVAGENGGGVFLLVYLACVALIGLPLVIAELAIGRRARRDAVAAFRALAPRGPWPIAGGVAVAASFLILSYYGVIAGWALKYFAGAATGALWPAAADGAGAYFAAFTAAGWEPVAWQATMMAAAAVLVGRGVARGIEWASRWLVPALFVVTAGLAVFVLTLAGAGGGVRFLFAPDWAALARPGVYLAALGQAFFSVGMGMAIFITYGSYLGRRETLPGAATAIVLGDTLIALIAGTAIFGAVFAFSMDPATGPELAFVTLPQIFLQMPAGRVVGAAFFFLLVAAALTSMVAFLEVPVAYACRRLRLSRPAGAALVAAAIFVTGLPAALGFGPLSDLRLGGRGILDGMDLAVSNYLLPVSGLLTALFAGWAWRRDAALGESQMGDGVAGRLWLWLLRLAVPFAILAVLARAVGAV